MPNEDAIRRWLGPARAWHDEAVELLPTLKGDAHMEERIVTDPITGGQKGTKLCQPGLIPPAFLEEVGKVYGHGAEKYAPHNWTKGYSWTLSLNALLRHILAFAKGECYDPNSGLHHLAHATFHLGTLFTFDQEALGTDDMVSGSIAQSDATPKVDIGTITWARCRTCDEYAGGHWGTGPKWNCPNGGVYEGPTVCGDQDKDAKPDWCNREKGHSGPHYYQPTNLYRSLRCR